MMDIFSGQNEAKKKEEAFVRAMAPSKEEIAQGKELEQTLKRKSTKANTLEFTHRDNVKTTNQLFNEINNIDNLTPYEELSLRMQAQSLSNENSLYDMASSANKANEMTLNQKLQYIHEHNHAKKLKALGSNAKDVALERAQRLGFMYGIVESVWKLFSNRIKKWLYVNNPKEDKPEGFFGHIHHWLRLGGYNVGKMLLKIFDGETLGDDTKMKSDLDPSMVPPEATEVVPEPQDITENDIKSTNKTKYTKDSKTISMDTRNEIKDLTKLKNAIKKKFKNNNLDNIFNKLKKSGQIRKDVEINKGSTLNNFIDAGVLKEQNGEIITTFDWNTSTIDDDARAKLQDYFSDLFQYEQRSNLLSNKASELINKNKGINAVLKDNGYGSMEDLLKYADDKSNVEASNRATKVLKDIESQLRTSDITFSSDDYLKRFDTLKEYEKDQVEDNLLAELYNNNSSFKYHVGNSTTSWSSNKYGKISTDRSNIVLNIGGNKQTYNYNDSVNIVETKDVDATTNANKLESKTTNNESAEEKTFESSNKNTSTPFNYASISENGTYILGSDENNANKMTCAIKTFYKTSSKTNYIETATPGKFIQMPASVGNPWDFSSVLEMAQGK